MTVSQATSVRDTIAATHTLLLRQQFEASARYAQVAGPAERKDLMRAMVKVAISRIALDDAEHTLWLAITDTTTPRSTS